MGKTLKYIKANTPKRTFRHTRTPDLLTIRQKNRLIKEAPVFKETNKYVNLQNVFSQRLYGYYKRQASTPLTKNRLFKLIKRFLRAMRKAILTNVAGVFIRKFGYFCVGMKPKRTKRHSLRTMGLKYFPLFMPIGSSMRKNWTFNNAFHTARSVAKYTRENEEIRKYKNAYLILQNIHGRKKITLPKLKESDNN